MPLWPKHTLKIEVMTPKCYITLGNNAWLSPEPLFVMGPIEGALGGKWQTLNYGAILNSFAF